MTYLAPRQGIFAIIMLASLGLHLLFFVVSSENQTNKTNQLIAEQMVEELSDALIMPMTTEDRVSMSVVSGRYVKEPHVAFVGVYDTKDNLLAPIGEENLGGHRTKNAPISSGEKLLGSVVVEMQPVNRATILSEQWIFLLATLVLHLLVWMAYTYLGRPTKELKAQIAKDVRAKLLTDGLLEEKQPAHTTQHTQAQPTEQDAQSAEEESVSPSTSTGSQNGYIVQICFDDPNHLLDAVAYDDKRAYFALCDQLLEKSVNKVLEMPLLANAQLRKIHKFSDSGASVEFEIGQENSKSAVAAMMLGQLVQMVYKIVYDKHRQLRRFALSTCVMVSDAAQANAVYIVSRRRNLPLVLLFDQESKAQVIPYVTLQGLENPSSVAERECQEVIETNRSTAERLRRARDSVLS